MNRIDYTGAVLALLMGFILSAGLTGFVLAAGGYQLPFHTPLAPVTMAGPAAAIAAPGPAPAQAKAAAPAGAVAAETKIVATDLKFTPATIQAKVGQPLKITYE